MITALANKLNLIPAIGIRMLVEAICEDKKVQGKNLREKIDDLANKDYLTKEGAKFLHSIRGMGNMVAHEFKMLTDEEVDVAMDIIEALFLNIYVLPKKNKRLNLKS